MKKAKPPAPVVEDDVYEFFCERDTFEAGRSPCPHQCSACKREVAVAAVDPAVSDWLPVVVVA